MTKQIVALDASGTAADAARRMRDANIGAVVITIGGQFFGIVTDRHIVIRSVVEGRSPFDIPLEQICSQSSLQTLRPDDDLGEAVRLSRRGPFAGFRSSPTAILSGWSRWAIWPSYSMRTRLSDAERSGP